MPEKKTVERARRAKRQGKAPTTQAGEFVREEIEHVREGKHGARSTKQAIAIGLSKARRAGAGLPPPPRSAKRSTKQSAQREPGRQTAIASVATPLACDITRVEARTATNRLAEGTVEAGKNCGTAATICARLIWNLDAESHRRGEKL